MKAIVVKDEEQVIDRLALELETCALQTLSDDSNVFRVGLSGGSVVQYLAKTIPIIECDVSKWKFFFCDERYVDADDGYSTFGSYKKLLIPTTCLKEDQFVPINAQLSLDDCARDYEEKILKEFQVECGVIPQFDLLLLGMGPDGHICSLFPEHALLKEQKRLIAPIYDSPKAPPMRVTMTFPLINNAKCCLFIVSGKSKANIVNRVFVNRENLPASMVKPRNHNLLGIFDEFAGNCFL